MTKNWPGVNSFCECIRKKKQTTRNRLNSCELPKYEIPPSIAQKAEWMTSVPIIMSKNEDEYDYVLVINDNAEIVYHPQTQAVVDENNNNNNTTATTTTTNTPATTNTSKLHLIQKLGYRREIMRRLFNSQLRICPEKHKIGELYLIKIRASDALLELWAEKMHLLMRLEGSGVYAPFQRSLKSQFQIATYFPVSIFRSSVRQLIINEILHRREWENGTELDETVLPAVVYMYPLHSSLRKSELYWKWKHGYNKWEIDMEYNNSVHANTVDSGGDGACVDVKQRRRRRKQQRPNKVWAFLWPNQPLNDIVEYFGEEVGFYFAFVEYFIKWMYLPTIAGTAIFFIQLKHQQIDNGESVEINGEKDTFLPFDIQTNDDFLPFFSLFMCVWTTVFIQFWKRREITLAYHWGVFNYEQKDHKSRLKFRSEYNKNKMNRLRKFHKKMSKQQQNNANRNKNSHKEQNANKNAKNVSIASMQNSDRNCNLNVLQQNKHQNKHQNNNNSPPIITSFLQSNTMLFTDDSSFTTASENTGTTAAVSAKIQRRNKYLQRRTLNRSMIQSTLKQRYCKRLFTTPIIFSMVLSCVVFMFWFLTMRASFKKKGEVIAIALHTCLWGLIVPIATAIHIKICQILNNWENWRTETEHYKYYTAKVCSLLLINTFVAMYYLTIFEKSLAAVGFQVAGFMIARLFGDILANTFIMPLTRKYKINNVIKKNKGRTYDPSSIHNPNADNDINIRDLNTAQNPHQQQYDHRHHRHRSYNNNNNQDIKKNVRVRGNKSPQEQHSLKQEEKIIDLTGDYETIKRSPSWKEALSAKYDAFKNYCFLILLFGYVSNFSIAFCLAPLAALIGMLFKLRSDRFHICCNTQRPLPRRVSGIGIWLDVLEQMCTFAIITNLLLIYFTTPNVFDQYLGSYADQYRIQVIVVFEHLLLGTRFLLKLLIPEVPLSVKAEMRIHELERLQRRKQLLEHANSQNQVTDRRRSSLNHQSINNDYYSNYYSSSKYNGKFYNSHHSSSSRTRTKLRDLQMHDVVQAIY